MKIAVMAGTLLDTEMGVKLLKEKGIDSYACPISQTPEEQDALQFLSPELLFEKVLKEIELAKKKGIQALFLYCNSLSAALPLKLLEEKIALPVITPFDAYHILGKEYSHVILLAANSLAAQKVEMALKEKNEAVSVLSIGYLELVRSIETCSSPKDVMKKHSLASLFDFFNRLPSHKEQIILLACTHFPYLKEEMDKYSLSPIVDPAECMIELLEKSLKK